VQVPFKDDLQLSKDNLMATSFIYSSFLRPLLHAKKITQQMNQVYLFKLVKIPAVEK
jgi:hypothetical protein